MGQIGGAPRTHAFQILQRRREQVVGHGVAQQSQSLVATRRFNTKDTKDTKANAAQRRQRSIALTDNALAAGNQ